jgi:hypothetical protein
MFQSPPEFKPSPDTLTLIYDYVRGIPEEQAKDIDSLSAKMVQIVTVAGVIMGLAGIIRVDSQTPPVANLLLVGALAGYLGVAGAALYHLWTRPFQRSVAPDLLWEQCWLDTPDEIRWIIIDKAGGIYEHNRKLIQKKARSVRWALVAASVEVVCFSLSVLAIRLSA